MEEDIALPEETEGQLLMENGTSDSTEKIHDHAEERRQSKESFQSKESLHSKESLGESNESLLNEDDDAKAECVNGEEENSKECESREDKEAIALKKRM